MPKDDSNLLSQLIDEISRASQTAGQTPEMLRERLISLRDDLSRRIYYLQKPHVDESPVSAALAELPHVSNVVAVLRVLERVGFETLHRRAPLVDVSIDWLVGELVRRPT